MQKFSGLLNRQELIAQSCEAGQKSWAARQIRSVSAIPSAAPPDGLSPSLRPCDVADLLTRELLEAVVGSGYAGHPWGELARRLVERALPDLEQSIHTGTIYHRSRRARLGIPQRQELQRRPMAQDIAAEAVEDCLDRFKVQVLPRGEWDPDRGTTLEDFFAACCLPHVANRWRWHLRQLPPHAIELDALDEAGQASVLAGSRPTLRPVAVVELSDLLTRTLAPTSPAAAAGDRPPPVSRACAVGHGAAGRRPSRRARSGTYPGHPGHPYYFMVPDGQVVTIAPTR